MKVTVVTGVPIREIPSDVGYKPALSYCVVIGCVLKCVPKIETSSPGEMAGCRVAALNTVLMVGVPAGLRSRMTLTPAHGITPGVGTEQD